MKKASKVNEHDETGKVPSVHFYRILGIIKTFSPLTDHVMDEMNNI